MNSRVLFDKIGSAQRFRVLERIKQADGITMAEIAVLVRLSYMGVRGHVNSLEKAGLITSRLRREKVGRPERLYAPTPKGHSLFQPEPIPFLLRTLGAAGQLYGVQAPEKILFGVVQSLQKDYLAKLKDKAFEDRVFAFVKMREKEGTIPKLEKPTAKGPFELLEFHPPFAEIEMLYPAMGRMERDMFEKVIGASVARSPSEDHGLQVVHYRIGEP